MIESITESQDSIYIKKGEEKIVFDLQTRVLVLTTEEDLCTRIKKLSPVDTHLLLALLAFYPHHASDAALAIGYTTDLLTYYTYLKGEECERQVDGSTYPIKDGIERLKRKLVGMGITVTRLHLLGYVLCSKSSKEGAALKDKMVGKILARN